MPLVRCVGFNARVVAHTSLAVPIAPDALARSNASYRRVCLRRLETRSSDQVRMRSPAWGVIRCCRVGIEDAEIRR